MPAQKAVAPPLPAALVWGGSIVIVLHFLAILMLVLGAQSGPWATATQLGMDSPGLGPLFASKSSEVVFQPYYLAPFHLNHDYHFVSNRLYYSQVRFEAVLKDKQGQVTVLKFPDPDANRWVRFRQGLLAQSLGTDNPIQPPRGESIAAPGKQMRTFPIWEPVKGQSKSGEAAFRLNPSVPEHLVAKDRPVFGPSEGSLALARSYARHLGHEHGAASVEIIRHSREPVMPSTMFLEDPPPGTFEELVSSFGEVAVEN